MGIKGYKAFGKGLICNPDGVAKQYKEYTTFEEDGDVNLGPCRKGVMHFCEDPFDVLRAYPLVNSDGEITEFAEVEAVGDVRNCGNQSITNKLHIGAKLNLKGFVKACVDFTIEKTKFDIDKDGDSDISSGDYAQIGSGGNSAQIGSSGNYAQIGSGGNYAQIGSSGYYAQIGSSGDYAKIGSSGNYAQIGSGGNSAQIGSSGYSAQIGSSGNSAQIGSSGYSAKIGSSGNYAQIGSSGDYAKIGSSGNYAQIGSGENSAQIGSSGDYAKIGSSGNYAQIGSSGYSAKIGSSGDYAQIGSSGDSAKITSEGKNSVVMAAGFDSMAKAKIGSWITLAEWVRVNDDDKTIWKPKCVKTEYVDGEKIKEDTFYKLIDGEFKEVKTND